MKIDMLLMADGEFPGFQADDQGGETVWRGSGCLKLRELQTLAEITRDKGLIAIT
jgi:hypothetical protein